MHVFEYSALKYWLSQSQINPATGTPLTNYDTILRITNTFLRQAPPWSALVEETRLTSEELVKFNVCMITLEPIETLKEPVAIRGDNAVHVFDYFALKTWLSQSQTNPANRSPLTSYDSVLRIANSFVQQQENKKTRQGFHGAPWASKFFGKISKLFK